MIFAHRGGSSLAPENTLAAFKQAVQIGCDGIELDVRLCASGDVVVCHDRTVDRTTNGHGKVARMTLSQLKTLDAGSWFNPKYPGERIPTLIESLAIIGDQAVINIELKPTAATIKTFVDTVSDIIEQFHLTDTILFSSFSAQALSMLNIRLPLYAKALLSYPGMTGIWARVFSYYKSAYQALHCYYKDISLKMISKYPRIHAYTVNHPSDMKRLFTWGISGIITDEPIKAMQIRAEVTS